MKLRKIMISLVAILAITISGCNGSKESSSSSSSSQSSTSIQEDVSEVVFNMPNTVLTPGSYTLVASCLPETASQLVKFTLVTSISGVTVSGTTLLVAVSAEDQAKFTIRASSIYDPTKSKALEFTINNPSTEVEITNEEQLFSIGTEVDGLAKKYVLKNDIVLTKSWEPLGTADVENDDGSVTPGEYFAGVFDGAGYTISGIDINGDFNEGFFEQIGTTGIVKNVKFVGKVNARGWSGAIAGINGGTITNVIVDVDVTVSGGSAGGLVSVNRGTISYAYAIGKVVSGTPNTSGRSAGLVAANEGVMTECYGDVDEMTTPNYIAFTPTLDASKMLSTGNMMTAATFITWDTDVWHIEDGLYPLLKHEGFVPPAKVKSVSITNLESEIDVEVTKTLTIQGVIINGTEEDSLTYTLVESVTGVSISGNVVNFTTDVVNLSTFTVKVTLNSDANKFATKTFKIINNPVPVEDVIYIATEADLINLANQTNPAALAKTYKLTADIALAGWYNKPIGNEATPFTGTFDGQGHTISGLKGGNEGAFNFGFFGVIGGSGVVKNFALIGAGGEVDLYVGAGSGVVAAVNNGAIENVIVNVNALCTGNWIGGFVANNFGTIKNSIVLGVVARNDDISASAPAFAIDNEGTITNCFVDKTTSKTISFLNAPNETYDAFLLETATMKTAATYSAFDTAIWNIVEGQYPTLKN
jgi:hypothetical protein